MYTLRLDVRERAFRNYVVWIRKEYGIKKPDATRQYEAVSDPPMGSQAQAEVLNLLTAL